MIMLVYSVCLVGAIQSLVGSLSNANCADWSTVKPYKYTRAFLQQKSSMVIILKQHADIGEVLLK